MRGRTIRKAWAIPSIPGNVEKEQRNWCETQSEIQSKILWCGDRVTQKCRPLDESSSSICNIWRKFSVHKKVAIHNGSFMNCNWSTKDQCIFKRRPWRLQNQVWGESFVFFGSRTFFRSIGCARSKCQCLTVLQNRKLYLWMLVFERMESLLLICGMWCNKYCILQSTAPQAGEDHCLKEKVDDEVPRSIARGAIQSTNPNTKSKRNSNREVDELSNVDHVVTNTKLCQFEFRLYIFEDSEAVIKMIIKGRSPKMRHVSTTHRVALDWLFDRVNADPTIPIKYVDTKNQLADILTKGNFTGYEWNHLLNLFNISHFSSTACTAAMAKRAQQGSGEERVTAESRPMMNLTARMPSVVSSSTSSNPVRTSYGYQDPGENLLQVTIDRGTWETVTTRLFKRGLWSILVFSRVEKWSCGARSIRETWDNFLGYIAKGCPSSWGTSSRRNMRIPQGTERRFTMDWGNLRQWITKERQIPKISSWAVTQQNLWTKSKTKCETDRMSNVAESGEEHSRIWVNVHGCDVKCGDIHGKEFLNYSKFRQEFWRSHVEADVRCHRRNWWMTRRKIHGLDNFQWEKNSWTRLSLIGDETVINLQSTKVYVFSDSVLCLGRVLQHPDSNEAWKNRIAGIQSGKSYRDYDAINGESTEFEWNIFPGFTTLQLCGKINDLLSDLGQTPETFTGRIFVHVNVQWHLLWQRRQQRWMFGKCRSRQSTCEKIWCWADTPTSVISHVMSGVIFFVSWTSWIFRCLFLHPFSLNDKSRTPCRRSAQERRTGEQLVVAEIKVSEFDIKKFERETISHVGFGLGETEAKKLSVKFLSVAEEILSLEIETSHELPMESKSGTGSGKHSVYTHFPKDPQCDICLKTEKNKGFLQKTYWYSRAQSGHFGDLMTADHKVLSEESESRNSHRYAVVVQDLATQWMQSYPCKTKTFQETQKSLMKCLDPTRKPKVIYTDIWNLASLARNYPGIIVRRHHTDQKQMGLPKEQCPEWKKVHLRCYCSPFWITNGRRILWMLRLSTLKISCLMGRHHTKGGTECPLRTSDTVWRMVEYHPISAKDQSRLQQFGPKVLPGIFLGYAFFAGRIWKGDLMVADIEELEEMDASELHARRLNAKDVLTPRRSWNFIFPVADGTVKIFGWEQRLRTSTLTRERPERGEEQEILQGKSNELHSPTPLQEDSTRDVEDAKRDFWTKTRKFIDGHHVEPRVKLYVPREELSPIPLKYIVVAKNNIRHWRYCCRKIWWLLERGWRKRIVRCMDSFHKFFLMNERPPDGTDINSASWAAPQRRRRYKIKKKKKELGPSRDWQRWMYLLP